MAAPRDGKCAVDSNQYADIAGRLCAAITEPGVLPAWVMQEIANFSREIQRTESERVMKTRSERSHLAPESQRIQEAIDEVLFHYFGLAVEDAAYIRTRLTQML